ncbi:hypothetical protein C1E23_00525 [Pseudoalteromonas phenolica]|uniref:Lipoprotein n=1 Tax=Pseudoalteromonas phenolica TaxID=161398 RepID=A0A4Q7ITS4_9GAMM|nr:hypothetical protein [Pseudoalteromonas phenolica]RZQ55056.1 hypothetical protein C1E23_00525 [Pseudoalteromonas phenolica]
MKLNRLTVTVITPLFLTACMSSKNYQEVYVEECDVPFKIVKKSTLEYPHFELFAPFNPLIEAAAVYSIVSSLATLDEITQQQNYYQEFKDECAKKGIEITEIPTEKRIYLNKRVPTKKNINSDSELSDIER